MRLTLRTLLAYLDDTLDPVRTREIGAKVAESESARELIERIKQVTRRRRLTTPDRAGSPETAVDANSVAEYLDNVLTPEEIGELEKLCLDSDVNLAEVSACHQILTVIVSEPTHVPPTAYQRMYAIAPGAEAIPHQQPKQRRRAEVEPVLATGLEETPLHFSGNGALTSRRRWLLGLAAAVLVGGLGVVIYSALTDTGPSGRSASRLQLAPARGTDLAPPGDRRERAATASAPVESRQATQLGTEGALPSVLASASWLAARPGMPGNWLFAANWPRPELPGNWFLVFGPDETIHAEAPPTSPATPPIETPAEASIRPPNAATLRLGALSAALPPHSLLFRREADTEWKLLRPSSPILSNEPLLALPGYRSEITLDNQVRLEVVGSLPLAMPNYFLESSVVLHPSSEADLDVTLLRGRIILGNRPEGSARIRLRFLDQAWDIQLLDPKSEVGVELTGRVPPGAGSWSPHFRLNVITSGGPIELRRAGKNVRVDPLRLVPWDNSVTPKTELRYVPIATVPNWMSKKVAIPDEVRAATARFSKRITDKLGRGGSEVNWIKVACQESFEEIKPWERGLALFTLGALDQAPMLLKVLETNEKPDVRVRAMDVLFHWLGRKPDQDAPLRDALRTLDFADADIEMVVRLCRGFDDTNRTIVDLLLDNMATQRQAIRELSYFSLHLQQIPPDKLAGYDPAAPAEVRENAARTIRTRLMGKN